ncbi:putative Ca2+/H+ antiporter, TMEM165/GDT1 family [Prauserella aidingensis]|uniref:TMEM165/GDT1 family protein n=1 Tax=Prauserella aidingensis TaxID=387890 RepID=UPI0020A53E0B|nr:TMEM165/GDT1 family protein [Prauserella aidingensis]MCP2254251.1 putative Ca2+/H+ antiporter, TMEM165/GDT1 family [Prauserella aidingensis]
MSTALPAFLTAFALVFVAELPDKTTVATLVLTTRYRAGAVWTGVTAAFAVQTLVAVVFGSALTLLPGRLVSVAAGVMFGIGAAILLRSGFRTRDDGDEDAMRAGPPRVPFLRAATASFGVLFAAEWGDASQLATAGLAARYAEPLAVGLGAFAAVACVTALAIGVGTKLRHRIRPHLLQRAAGVVFAGLAAYALGTALLG